MAISTKGGNTELTDLTLVGDDGEIRRMSTTTTRFARTGTKGGNTRRFNYNLALLAREMVPPELLIEFHLAILQGFDPVIKQDGRSAGGWRVHCDPKAAHVPTLDQKVRTVDFLRQAGWGLPAQAHYVDMDVKSANNAPTVELGALASSPKALSLMVGALRAAIDAGRSQRVLDAESSEPAQDPQNLVSG